MLAIDVIESKPYFVNPNTRQQYLDLTVAAWDTRRVQYQLKNIAIVTEETEGRPDLLGMLYSGDQSKMGTILKLNNISNPLSLKINELLLIPSDKMTKDLFKSGQKITDQKQKAKTFRKELQEKISQVSKDRLEYLNARNISNIAEAPLPPNLLQEGEQQILVEDGKLIFGPNIGQCRNKPRRNVSVTDIKTKLAQKNIFRR
jgi:hypothetical protein